jgi:DNA-binding GntR family transcriptional regulator
VRVDVATGFETVTCALADSQLSTIDVSLPQISDHQSLADRAHAAIREAIVSGRLRGGERLVEAQLARDLGTSRGPVREALRRLSDEGLADILPRRGAVVRTRTPEEIRAISDFRIAIETMAARLAVRHAVSTAPLHNLVARLARAAARGDEQEVVALDLAFHGALCEASANPYLTGAYQQIEAQIRMFVALGDAHYDDLAALPPEHEAIVVALESGDEVAADQAIRTHILDGVSLLVPGVSG